MNKMSILTLVSALVLSTSSVFAQTDTNITSSIDQKVEEILAEIQTAKNAQTKKVSPMDKETDNTVETKVEEILAEIATVKATQTKEISSIDKETDKTVETKVEEILAEIAMAKAAQTKEISSIDKEVNVNEVNTKANEILAEIETVKTVQMKEVSPADKEVKVQTKQTITPVVTKAEPEQTKTVAIQPKTQTVVAQSTPSKKSAFEHAITLPTVPKPPKAMQLSAKLVDENGHIISQNLEDIYPPRKKIYFSSNVAPERFSKKKKAQDKEILPGDIENSRVTAYIQSPLLTVEEVTTKLKNAGFEILSTYKVDKKGTVTSLVFTNEAMKKAASTKMRGFAGTLRVVIDTKNKLVNISNPIYVMKAFMQQQYNPNVAEKTLADLRSQFSDLVNSKEVVKFTALERYQFMENMPFYQDMKIIAKAKNEELLKKVQKSKKVLYTQYLDNGSIVVGVQLGKRTSKFVKKIGYQNSGLLPYPVLIEKGEAKIMAPQYYIAVMYPQLKMSKFMTIATVPGAITKDIDKIFR